MKISKRTRDEAVMVLKCAADDVEIRAFIRELPNRMTVTWLECPYFSRLAFDAVMDLWGSEYNYTLNLGESYLEAAAMLEHDNWNPGDPVERIGDGGGE